MQTSWKRFYLNDFPLDKNGKPYLYATSISSKGLEPRKKAVFFHSKIIGEYVYIPESEITKTIFDNWLYDIAWPTQVGGDKI